MTREQMTKRLNKLELDALLANPLPAVYEKNAPRIREGEHLLSRKLCDDLHVYIRFFVEETNEDYIGSIVATEENIAAAYTDTEQLFAKATENAQSHGITRLGLESMVRCLVSGEDDQKADTYTEKTEFPLVLKINAPGYGAGVLAIEPTMRSLCGEFGDLLILPSSIHEVIILPSHMLDLREAAAMVRQINREILDPREVLSDDVFVYDNTGFHRVHAAAEEA